MDIHTRLEAEKDTKYRDFHAKLIPGIQNFMGVRIPILRRIAKEIVKEDRDAYFKQIAHDWCKNYSPDMCLTDVLYEEKMICAFVIATITDISEASEKIKIFVPIIDNWAVCDSFCAALKIAKKHPDALLPLIKTYVNSAQEFEVRFAIVMLLDHYLTDTHIDTVLDLYRKITHKAYYVNMGLAWGLSICYIKYPEKTDRFIAEQNLDEFTLKKYKQKVRESLRTPCSKTLCDKKL